MSDFEDNPYPAELAQRLYQFALDRQFTDFTITAKNTTIHCHQVVISAHSEFFRLICLSGNKEASLEHSVLRDDGHVLAGVIESMYLGVTEITVRNVEALLLAANFIKFEQLKRKCEHFIIANLSVHNLLMYHNLAKKVCLSNLIDACILLSREKFQEVSKTEWLPALSIDEVIAYLKDNELKAESEDQVVDALNLWLQNSVEPKAVKEDSADELLSCVRLRFCSKAKLEAIAKDTMVMEKFRFKIMEYLLHGWHGEGEPRKSYRGTRPKEQEGDAPKASDEGRSKEQEGSARKAYRDLQPKEQETEKMYKETVVIEGGFKSDNTKHANIVSIDSQAEDSVITQSQISADTYNYSLCSETDSLIVSGGKSSSTGNSIPKVNKFCTTTGKWINLPDMPEARDGHGSALLNNKLYIIGGCYKRNNSIEHVYNKISTLDLDSCTWCECNEMPEALYDIGIAVVSDQILVIGGRTATGSISKQTDKYNFVTNTWTKCQPMQRTGIYFDRTAVIRNKVFVGNTAMSFFLQYDVPLDQWTELKTPPKETSHCALASKQGCILALGGSCIDGEKTDYVQRYDPSNNTWTLEKQTLPLPLYMHSAVVLSVPKSK